MFIVLTEPTTYDFPALGAAIPQNVEIAHAVNIAGFRLVGLAVRLHAITGLAGTTVKAVGTAVWPEDGETARFEDTGGPVTITGFISTALPGTMQRTTPLLEMAAPFLRVVINALGGGGGGAAGSITLSVGLLLEPM